MKTNTAHKGTRQIPVELHGTGNHLIARFLLVIGEPSLVSLPAATEPIHLTRQAMAGILRLWRATGGKLLDRACPHSAAIFDLAPALLPALPTPTAAAC